MPLPQIDATNPTTVSPVTEEKIFNKWWVKNIHMRFPNGIQSGGNVMFVKYRTLADGTLEFSDETVSVQLPNLWERAGVNADFGAIMAGVLIQLDAIGKELGKI